MYLSDIEELNKIMKLHKSNHGLLFSIIVLILCYIIFSGCISSPTKMTSPSVQTTSNKFTTYTDQIKGFSIDYPSDWSKQTISSSQNQYIIMFLPPDQGCSITVSVLPSQSSGKDVKEWANGMITNGPQKWPGFSWCGPVSPLSG